MDTMSLTFQVLRCFKCSVFQVHPTKKANKWACKLCNEKQSIKRFYSLGTAKECRLRVQELNAIRGEIEGARPANLDSSEVSNSPHVLQKEIVQNYFTTSRKSKWQDYLEVNNEENQETSSEMSLNETEVVMERPKKKLKKTPKKKENNFFNNNNSPPAKLENNFSKYNDSNCNKPVTLINKAEPRQGASANKNVVYTPVVSNNSKWAEFVDEYQLNDPIINESRSGPSEWFSSVDDDDLDDIFEF